MIQEDMICIKVFTWGKFSVYFNEGRLNKPLMDLASLEKFDKTIFLAIMKTLLQGVMVETRIWHAVVA